MTEKFEIGDPVWAKMKRYVPWPARIAEPKDLKKSTLVAKRKQNLYWVYFFGTHDCAWIEGYNIRSYKKHRDDLISASKAKTFEAGIQEIEQYLETYEPRPPSATRKSVSDTEEDADAVSEKEKPPVAKKKKQGVKRLSTGGSQSPSKTKQIKSLFGGAEENGMSYVSPVKPYEHLLNRPTVMERPETPPPDLGDISEKNKNIAPSKLKFGFLGLGIMASGMVKNLINSGHRLNLWCEDPTKCEYFKTQADANSANAGLVDVRSTPYDVVQNSDVVFCCLSGPQAAKEIVQGNCGVLHDPDNSLENKGYVELTGVDAETSKDTHALITSKGGRYLEAQIQGSKKEADEGNLIILGAGDITLFDDCLSCFRAMGKTAFHLGEVGYASKMNLILQVMHGIALAGLAEGFALAERSGLTLDDVLKIFSLTNLNCPYLYNKAEIIINEKFQECQQPLQSMQKDLRLAIQLADSLQQPLLMTSTANEIFKHARRLGYDKHDSASVFVRARH